MYDIVGKRRWYFLFSALITIPGIVFILLGGLKPSVDFTGGTVWQVRYASDPSPQEVQAALVDLGHPEATVRRLSDGYLEIRTEPIGLLPPQTPLPSVSLVPSASGRRVRRRPPPSPSPTASPTPAASPSLAPIAARTPSGVTVERALRRPVQRGGWRRPPQPDDGRPADRFRAHPLVDHPDRGGRAVHPCLPVGAVRVPLRHGRASSRCSTT